MAERRNCRFIPIVPFPPLSSLPLPAVATPATRGSRAGHASFDINAFMEQAPRNTSIAGRLRRTRMTRTSISRREVRAFLTALFNAVGATGIDISSRASTFPNPYNGVTEAIPTSMEELLVVYNMLQELHNICLDPGIADGECLVIHAYVLLNS